MAPNIFGKRVHDDISSEFEWILKHWRHKGAVYNQNSSLFFADLGNSLDIDASHGWVCRRLNPDHGSIRLNCFFDFLQIKHGDSVPFDSCLGHEDLSKVSLCPTVDVIYRQN
jgi:hypothetical protein